MLSLHQSVHNRPILLLHETVLPEPSQFQRGLRRLSDQRHAARLAVEAVDELRMAFLAEVKPQTADQARINVAFGGMAHQVGGLVDDEQIVVFMQHLEELIHAASIGGLSQVARVSGGGYIPERSRCP